MTALLCTVIVIAALAVRLPLTPQEGYGFDVGVNQWWSRSAVELGIVRSYGEQVGGNMLPNYPPLSIEILAGVGHLYRAFVSPEFENFGSFRIAIKLPVILADVAACIVLFFLFRRLRNLSWGTAAGLVYALHPAVLYDSAVWGQTDSLYALAILLAITCALQSRWTWSGGAAAAAMLLKTQAVFFLPLWGLLIIRNDQRFGRALFGGMAVACAVLLPFAVEGSLSRVVDVYRSSIGYYPDLTSGGWNFWLALYGNEVGKPDTDLFFGLFEYRTLGILIFGSLTAFILWKLRRWLRPGAQPEKARMIMIMLCAALLSYAFFLFPTEMHERYLFPFTALGMPLILTGPAGIALYAWISLLFLGNLMGILQIGPIMQGFFHEFPGMERFIAASHVMAFVLLCIHVFRTPRRWIPREERVSLLRRLVAGGFRLLRGRKVHPVLRSKALAGR